MRVHHLNCGTCCPLGGRLFDGTSDGLESRLVCHCMLVESDAGLILVDTGLGARDVALPRRLSRFFRTLNNLRLDPEETALAQVRRLGFAPEDVRHIVVTHLDFDHAGGLEDFPKATVHVTAREKEAADAGGGAGFVSRRRYRPQQWAEVDNWSLYPFGGGEAWFGFDTVRDLAGLPPDILLVPLPGHSRGHVGVAVRERAGWLLYASDAYFYRGEIGAASYACTPGLRFYQALLETDRRARLANLARLRRLALDPAGEVRIFCAHDAVEFEMLAGQH